MFALTKLLVSRFATVGLLCELFFSPVMIRAQELRVAAAADLQPGMKDLAAKYQTQTHRNVEMVYGSSGNFFTQIENGAPFDLFFSADLSYPTKLIDQGLADKDSLYRYGLGRIVIWASADQHLNVSEKGFQSLLSPQVKKIAIANPEHAPYGRAAVAALEKAGLYDQVKCKLVYGENISQAAQFVQSQNAQVGLIALSLAISPMMAGGDRWLVPFDFHPPLQQAVVIIAASKNKKAAADFLNFVRSPAGREVLSNYGFLPPAAQKDSAHP